MLDITSYSFADFGGKIWGGWIRDCGREQNPNLSALLFPWHSPTPHTITTTFLKKVSMRTIMITLCWIIPVKTSLYLYCVSPYLQNEAKTPKDLSERRTIVIDLGERFEACSPSCSRFCMSEVCLHLICVMKFRISCELILCF